MLQPTFKDWNNKKSKRGVLETRKIHHQQLKPGTRGRLSLEVYRAPQRPATDWSSTVRSNVDIRGNEVQKIQVEAQNKGSFSERSTNSAGELVEMDLPPNVVDMIIRWTLATINGQSSYFVRLLTISKIQLETKWRTIQIH